MSLDDAQWQAIMDAFDNAATYVLFCIVISVAYGMLILGLLFVSLAVRSVWRWLTNHSFSDLIVVAERRALRGRS
jgi:hypothetical protein